MITQHNHARLQFRNPAVPHGLVCPCFEAALCFLPLKHGHTKCAEQRGCEMQSTHSSPQIRLLSLHSGRLIAAHMAGRTRTCRHRQHAALQPHPEGLTLHNHQLIDLVLLSLLDHADKDLLERRLRERVRLHQSAGSSPPRSCRSCRRPGMCFTCRHPPACTSCAAR